MRRIATRFAVLVAAAFPMIGLSVASLRGQESAPATLDGGLVRVPDTKAKLAYLRPGTDLKKYTSVHIQPLVVPLTARDTTPPGERPRPGESYLLQDKDVAQIQDLYGQVFRDVVGRTGIKVVETSGPDTLIVATQVSNIVLKAPLENTRERAGERVRTWSEGGGTIAIQAVLADGGSGQVIAVVADSKHANNLWQRNTRLQNLADLKRAFAEWARALSKHVGRSA